jgi:hypothetical protein
MSKLRHTTRSGWSAVAVCGLLGGLVFMLITYRPPQTEWCRSDAQGQVALEREVRHHLDSYHRNPHDPPPYSAAEVRRILLAECDREW